MAASKLTLSGDNLKDENQAIAKLCVAIAEITGISWQVIVTEAPVAFGLSPEFAKVETEAARYGIYWDIIADTEFIVYS